MKSKELYDSLFELKKLDVAKDIKVCKMNDYAVWARWFDKQNCQIENADKNGIYFLTSEENEVLYIGKGNYKLGGGIGNRSCSHFGKPQKKDRTFPEHKWIQDNSVDKSIKEMLYKGRVKIVTIPIEPVELISLAEVYLQTICFLKAAKAIPLNKRIG